MAETKRKKSIKVVVRRRKPMSHDGILRWNKKMRIKVRKQVFEPMRHLTRLPVTVNNKDKLAEWLFENCNYGVFYIQTFGGAKTKTGIGFKRASKVEILPLKDPTGKKPYVANFLDIRPLSRYWFWQSM